MSVTSKFLSSFVIAALTVAAVPALAQTASIAAGAKVGDPAGGAVGTIVSADAGYGVVKTDKHEVRLPATSFTKVDSGYIIAMTQAELNAAVEKSLAEAASAIAVGATVRDPQGGVVGTIEALDEQFATVKLAKIAVKLPRTAFAVGPEGPVIGNTAAELEAQAAAAE